ncbi:MAG: helix-turn-helix domain-containing protein [Gemmatimonadales bacterium]
MRLRLPELLKARDMTPYALAQASRGRISMSLAYRMQRERGAFKCLSPDAIDALCEILGVEPGDLFERASQKKVRRG